jgi:hypothetical protein
MTITTCLTASGASGASFWTNNAWFWGVDFQITGRKSYGHASTLDDAKAAFRAEYEAWKGANGQQAVRL